MHTHAAHTRRTRTHVLGSITLGSIAVVIDFGFDGIQIGHGHFKRSQIQLISWHGDGIVHNHILAPRLRFKRP